MRLSIFHSNIVPYEREVTLFPGMQGIQLPILMKFAENV
jgi:hypothetical protein